MELEIEECDSNDKYNGAGGAHVMKVTRGIKTGVSSRGFKRLRPRPVHVAVGGES